MFQDPADFFRSKPAATTAGLVRKHLRITGRVQGVGFRPFIYRLARQFELTGIVCNDPAGVSVEAQGHADQLNNFIAAIRNRAPAAAAVREVVETLLRPCEAEDGFTIVTTQTAGAPTTEITPDLALCPDCLADIRNAHDTHRHGYALTNCTNCGPRYSIVRNIPYDRRNTTMAGFTLCDSCREEYENPGDRRFHAQPNACRKCGPRVSLVLVNQLPLAASRIEGLRSAKPQAKYNPITDAGSEAIQRAGSTAGSSGSSEYLRPGVDDNSRNPITTAAELLRAGKIVAIKGIGGYHLAVAANNAQAVDRLRELKHRPAKPFALMCPTLQAARQYVELSRSAEKLLTSPAAPIVLAPRRDNTGIAAGVAPGSHRLGILLAYTPLHHLLFDALGSVDCLVMTSGNDVDEPLVFDENPYQLAGICDAILTHNRPIERAVDDSVILDAPRSPIFLRRSRGFTPAPITLPTPQAGCERYAANARIDPATSDLPTGLCLGAEMKNTVALVQNGQVILSQHLGNLTRARTFNSFKLAIDDLCRLFAAKPQWIAHDLHPQYLSTQYAKQLAAAWDVPLIGVQHHHAHAAGVLAEHEITEPALAVVCDGTGFGTDGTIWGGEILEINAGDFRRLGRLKPIRLAGGDASAKHPWRSAMSLLQTAYGDDFLKHPAGSLVTRASGPCVRLPNEDASNAGSRSARAGGPCHGETDVQFVGRMLINNISCVQSSSTGRIFDGVAALLGLCTDNRYDAEAPALLESTAASSDRNITAEQGFTLCDTGGLTEIDLSPLVRQIVDGVIRKESTADLAMLFHVSLADAFAAAVTRAMRQTARRTVALSGGVFCNALFTELLTNRLEQTGATVLRHRVVPPNDGGISFGQAVVACRGMGVPPMRPLNQQLNESPRLIAHGRDAHAT
jgi:hydrogenase maturation protein HypF